MDPSPNPETATPEPAGEEKEKFFDPVTGEQISKNAYKKLLKGAPAKKDKPAKAAPAAAEGEEKAKKEKKEKVAKEPEAIFVDQTPAGQKKQIEGVFPPTYQPKYVEAAWQSWWESSGFYCPDTTAALSAPASRKFVMVIPPPNVTGSLHLGHALAYSIEDLLTRWHRMRGEITLWVPGTDHAGIATQSVVEKRLKKEEGLTRHDLGREEFVRRVWEWKEKYGNTITRQIRSIAASVDWTREAFTMDKNLSAAVNEAFVRFYEDGLMYRDTRLINWSCALQSAISEIEVDYIDLEGVTILPVPNHSARDLYEFGTLTSFAYPVYNPQTHTDIAAPTTPHPQAHLYPAAAGAAASTSDMKEIVVATTRLETMLGDTGVAVHPEDPRYTHLHGSYVLHPFTGLLIPIITDATLVDMSFGTGAVKVTPAHDPNDFDCGKRNNLEFTIMLTSDGKIAKNGGKFAGLMRYDARIAIEEELKTMALFRGKVPNKMRLGQCSRSGDIIEPMLTPQWYVNCQSMAAQSIEKVRNGELKIVPEMHEQTWYRWLENIRDWCVSRQLWWGHRIPAYFARTRAEHANTESPIDKNAQENNSRWVVARTQEAALTLAAQRLGVPESEVVLEQDEDVLDTWFSSGLFPFSVFGWPNNTVDLDAFFPTTLLETGLDILFFWVARMVMMGLHLTGKLPFSTVYLHAMVRDKYGRKMSKSLGNVIDPLEVIYGCGLEDLLAKIDAGNLPQKEVEKAKEGQGVDFPEGIPECGADALRFGLLAYTTQGRDINLDIKRVVGYRQFCNKLWNAVKFGLTYLSGFEPSPDMGHHVMNNSHASPRDLFILSRLNTVIAECNQHLTEYNFGSLASSLHSFFLYDFCDVYLELIKPVMYDESEANAQRRRCAQITLYTVLETYLRLMHPLMPFVTEELWQRLPNREKLTTVPSIMIAEYPTPVAGWSHAFAVERMEIIKEAIHGARSLRADYKIANNVKADFYFRVSAEADASYGPALTHQGDDFCTLARGNFLRQLQPDEQAPQYCCVKVLNNNMSLLVNLEGIVDIDQEIARLRKESEKLQPMIDQYRRKVTQTANDSKVPEAVKATNAEKLTSYEAEMSAVLQALSLFEGMKK